MTAHEGRATRIDAFIDGPNELTTKELVVAFDGKLGSQMEGVMLRYLSLVDVAHEELVRYDALKPLAAETRRVLKQFNDAVGDLTDHDGRFDPEASDTNVEMARKLIASSKIVFTLSDSPLRHEAMALADTLRYALADRGVDEQVIRKLILLSGLYASEIGGGDMMRHATSALNDILFDLTKA